jgi:fumarate hydratase class II
LAEAVEVIKMSMKGLYKLAIGGTAVGTGLNAPKNFGHKVASEISRMTGYPFVTASNEYAAQASLDAMVNSSSALRLLAVVLMKMANDIRWVGSGPRAGIHELILPENEPGSSIMPGKVNPTQEEAMVMVCIQVMGNDTAVGIAGSQGNFELNAMRPIIIKNVLDSSQILGDACDKLRRYSMDDITFDTERIDKHVKDALMLVTALTPVIGYDKATSIAHKAFKENLTLREAAISSGHVSLEDYDNIVEPSKMVGDPNNDLKVIKE